MSLPIFPKSGKIANFYMRQKYIYCCQYHCQYLRKGVKSSIPKLDKKYVYHCQYHCQSFQKAVKSSI